MAIPSPRQDDVGYMRRGKWVLVMRADGTWEGSHKFPQKYIDQLNAWMQHSLPDKFQQIKHMMQKFIEAVKDPDA